MAAPIGFSTVSVPHATLPTKTPVAAGANKVYAASQDFEAVFLTNMFENMFEGLDDDGPFGSGAGNGAWRSMLTEEYAKTISASGGIGITSQIERQLVAVQENHQ